MCLEMKVRTKKALKLRLPAKEGLQEPCTPTLSKTTNENQSTNHKLVSHVEYTRSFPPLQLQPTNQLNQATITLRWLNNIKSTVVKGNTNHHYHNTKPTKTIID